MKSYLRLTIVCLLVLSLVRAAAAEPFPKGVHRILFLGNSITYAGGYIVDIEAYFTTHYPKRHFEFINVGLPSETVSGLSEPGHAGGRPPRPLGPQREREIHHPAADRMAGGRGPSRPVRGPGPARRGRDGSRLQGASPRVEPRPRGQGRGYRS